MLNIIEKLDIKLISSFATLRPKHWRLDGSMLIPETSGAKGDMYIDIYNYKAKYINDSIIAEAAIRCHCTLITSDDRLFKKVNKHFPGKVISLSDYLKQIS